MDASAERRCAEGREARHVQVHAISQPERQLLAAAPAVGGQPGPGAVDPGDDRRSNASTAVGSVG